mgnify:CR=1 FL=1
MPLHWKFGCNPKTTILGLFYSVIGWPKTITIMERTKIIFCAAASLKDYDGLHDLECYVNADNNIFISIGKETPAEGPGFTVLDRATAIKFVKHLKREIAKLEVTND